MFQESVESPRSSLNQKKRFDIHASVLQPLVVIHNCPVAFKVCEQPGHVAIDTSTAESGMLPGNHSQAGFEGVVKWHIHKQGAEIATSVSKTLFIRKMLLHGLHLERITNCAQFIRRRKEPRPISKSLSHVLHVLEVRED